MILDQVKIKYSTQVTHTRTTVQETVTQTDAEYQHQNATPNEKYMERTPQMQYWD